MGGDNQGKQELPRRIDDGLVAFATILAMSRIAVDPDQLRHALGHFEPVSADELLRLAKRQGGVRARAIDAYAAVAGSVRSQLVEAGVPPGKVFTIYSGTDTAVFHPRPANTGIAAKLSLPKNVPVISLIGNLSRDKGQHILAAAGAELIKNGSEFILLFAGQKTDSADMKEILSQAGFPIARARLLGLRRDVPELLSVTSISVNCAVKGEALSGSIRESLAMGVPVIASDISGNCEIVLNGKTGMLFKPGDRAGLAGKLALALSTPGLLTSMKKAGVELVQERFSSVRMAADTLALYRKFI